MIRCHRTAVYVDDETRAKVNELPRRMNLSGVVRVVVAAMVMSDKELSRWLKADKERLETFLWIKEKVGGQRKLGL